MVEAEGKVEGKLQQLELNVSHAGAEDTARGGKLPDLLPPDMNSSDTLTDTDDSPAPSPGNCVASGQKRNQDHIGQIGFRKDSFDRELIRLETEHKEGTLDSPRLSVDSPRRSGQWSRSSVDSRCSTTSSLSSYRDSFEKDVKKYAKRDGFVRGAASKDTPNTSMVKANARGRQLEAELEYEEEMENLLANLGKKLEDVKDGTVKSNDFNDKSNGLRDKTNVPASAARPNPEACRSRSSVLYWFRGSIVICFLVAMFTFLSSSDH